MRYSEKYGVYVDEDCVLYFYARHSSYGRVKGRFYQVKINDDKEGYPRASIEGHPYVHQIVFNVFHGEVPEGMTIDHWDRNRHNWNPDNLHLATRKQQCDNTSVVDASVERYGVRACEDMKAYKRAWLRLNPGKCSMYCKNYRARMKANGFKRVTVPGTKKKVWVKDESSNPSTSTAA